MEKIVVSSVPHESKTASSLCKIYLTKKDNLKEKSDVGFGATAGINDLLKRLSPTNLLNPSKKTARKKPKLLERSLSDVQ